MTEAESGASVGIRRHDHELDQQEKKARDRQRMFLDRSIERGYDAMSMGDWRALAEICDGLYHSTGLDVETLDYYDEHADVADFPWHFEAVSLWVKVVIRKLDIEAFEAASLVVRPQGPSTYETVGEYLSDLFLSLETATVVEQQVQGEFESKQRVLGFEGQLGERYVRPESSAGGDLDLRDADDEMKSILCAGGKGSGKSTAVETLTMDSFRHGHKIVDLVDFMKSENAVYDIPQQDNGEGLIKAREQMGLRTGFDDLELGLCWLDGEEPEDGLVGSPNVEIYVPLTPGLAEMDVPTIPNVGESTVKPFTIPASDLTYRQLIMLLHHTTTARENHLRSAHQKLRDSGTDWTLADVAETVKHETNAGEKMAEQIETSLRTAQDKGFIRDKECPYALDWHEIMADENTITAFSVHTVREKSDRLMALSYLIDSLDETRRDLIRKSQLRHYPPMTVVMREMHEVAPRSKAEQNSESVIESYMIDTLSELFALTRHADLEILADTQKFYRQLSPEVSGLFDHIFAFRGYVPDVKRIFKTRTDDSSPADYIAQFNEPGRCAFISEAGPVWPIQIAPPRCHHLEASTDGSGLGFRGAVEDTPERMLPAPWDADVPGRLHFDDITLTPLELFFEKYIEQTGDTSDYTLKSKITHAYNQWAEANDYRTYEGEEGHRQLHEKVVHHFGLQGQTDARPTVNGKKRRAHRTILLKNVPGNTQTSAAAVPG